MMTAQNDRMSSEAIRDSVSAQTPTVFVIDPDPATGRMVKDLLQGCNVTVQVHALGREFVASYDGKQSGCLVLEQRIFDMSGFQIQQRLAEQNQRLPMVYVTSGLDVSTAVLLMRGGATHILEKPLRPIELLSAIQEAVAIDQDQRSQECEKRRVKESIALLTSKERQLVGLIACAKSTKAIAAELSICSRAVELRRRAVMDKLGLTSSLELIKFALLACRECSHYLDCAGAKADESHCHSKRLEAEMPDGSD